MKAFLQSTLKLTVAISLALIATAAVVAGGFKFFDKQEQERLRADAAPLERVLSRSIDRRKPLSLTFTVETKVVDGYMYGSVTAEGFPKYLEHPTNKANGAFILNFTDSDGFKLYEKSIPIRDFTTVVGTQATPTGLSYQFKEFISLSEYKRFTNASIGWTVDEKLVPVNAQPPVPNPTVSHPDPCAPGLSKSERLSRLANFGSVKQTGNDSYAAGSRSVAFSSYNNTLLYCY